MRCEMFIVVSAEGSDVAHQAVSLNPDYVGLRHFKRPSWTLEMAK